MTDALVASVRLITFLTVAAYPFVFNGHSLVKAQESGSNESKEPPFSVSREILQAESGSDEKPKARIPFERQTTEPETRSGAPPTDGEGDMSRPEPSSAKPGVPVGLAMVSPGLVLVIVFLVGVLLVVWILFRLGLFNPYTATLWPKRLELCIEIALRTDDFMSAFSEENFNKCQMALEALNHLNGRRSILLSNEINAAVNKFVEQAVNVKMSKGDDAFQKDLNRKYELVIEALRVGTRQEELSLEVLRSLTKAQGPYRRLKEPASE